jgi:cyclic lactone autoinducer peptide
MKTISKLIAAIALKAAVSAAGAASDWCTYQPKEPEILKAIVK